MPQYPPQSASFLISVIIAFLRQSGGEFRIKRQHLDIDEKMGYYCDSDNATNEMVFKLASREGTLVFVSPQSQPQPEGTWIDPASPSAPSSPKRPTPISTPQTAGVTEPPRRTANNLDSNEKLRDLEAQMLRRRIARMVMEEQREKARGA